MTEEISGLQRKVDGEIRLVAFPTVSGTGSRRFDATVGSPRLRPIQT